MRVPLVAVLSAAFLAACGSAGAKDRIVYAHLNDPAIGIMLHALDEGIVASDRIEVETVPLPAAALLRATPTGRYDVVMSSVLAIPRARARGLDLVVLSTAARAPAGREGGALWVRADSPYGTPADLKGKTVATIGLRSTGTTWLRLALWKKHGIDVSSRDGDYRWVDLPAAELPGALEAGRVDAASLIHSQAWEADRSGRYRVLAYRDRDIHELYGVEVVPAVNVGHRGKLDARPGAFREFNRMLKASVDHALANRRAVGAAVGARHGIPAEFLEAWMTRFSFFPATVSAADVRAMDAIWAGARELGILDRHGKAETVIWEHAIRE